MATALINQPSVSSTASTAPTAATTGPSPTAAFFGTMALCIAIVWVVVTAMLLVLADTTFLAAVGVGGFASFWLGGGFGAIFGSAAAFGGDH